MQVVIIKTVGALLQRLVLFQFLGRRLLWRPHVGEYELCSLDVVVLLVALPHVFGANSNSPVRITLGDRLVHKPDVHSRFARVTHDRQHVVLAFLRRAFPFLKLQGSLGDLLHVVRLRLRALDGYRSASASALDRWNREFLSGVFFAVGVFDVLHRHRVGNLVVNLQQRRDVDELLQAGRCFVPLS